MDSKSIVGKTFIRTMGVRKWDIIHIESVDEDCPVLINTYVIQYEDEEMGRVGGSFASYNSVDDIKGLNEYPTEKFNELKAIYEGLESFSLEYY